MKKFLPVLAEGITMKKFLPVLVMAALIGTAAYSIVRNGASACLVAGSCHVEGGIADKLFNARDEAEEKR